MLYRFTRIRNEFGNLVLGRVVFLLVGLVGLSAFGLIAFKGPWAAIIAVIGLVAGWLLRSLIVEWAESLFWAMPAALFVYGVVLFLGERVLDISREAQLLIITATTVLLFDVQFWSLSDPAIVNTERN